MLRIRIRDPGPLSPLYPGSGIGKKSGSGSEMNTPDHISESLETNSLMRIWDGKIFDPGWEKFGSGIRDKHPGFETLRVQLGLVLRFQPPCTSASF